MKRALALLAALLALVAGTPAAAQAIWFGDGSHVGSIDSASGRLGGWVPAGGVRSIVALRDGGAWLVQPDRLARVSRDGTTVAEAALAAGRHDAIATGNDAEDGIWLAAGGAVRHYDGAGRLAHAFEHPADVVALAAAGPEAVIVASSLGVVRHRADGSVVAALRADAAEDVRRVTRLLLDPGGGYVWAIGGGEAIRLDLLAGLVRGARVPLDAGATSAGIDPASGVVWTLGARLHAFDRDGQQVLDVASPAAAVAEPAALAADALTSLLWVGDRAGLGVFNLATLQWLRYTAGAPVTLLATPGLGLRPAVALALAPGDAATTLRLKVGATCGGAVCAPGERYLRSLAVEVDPASAGSVRTVSTERESGEVVVDASPSLLPGGAPFSVVASDAYGIRSEPLRIDAETLASERARARPEANVPPVVTLTAPAANATYVAPATINLAATASDSDGTIAKVEFYQGATRLATDTAAPYAWSWTNVPVGSYTLSAKAYDNLGAITTSGAVTVQVNANVAPTVALTAPANNSAYTAPATINLAATASDTDGTIAKVEFFKGTTRLATDTTAPYAYTWANVAGGTYSLTAKATDNKGAVTTSTAVTVKVNKPPTVSITSPANNASLAGPLSITIAAAASDADGTIAKVQFYRDGVLLGQDTAAPYSFAWANVPLGTYALTAKATDNLGASTDSAPVTVTVRANVGPTVALTAPPSGSAILAGTPVTIAATATDADGAVAKVEFFATGATGNQLLGTDTASPYTITVSLAAGTTSLTAVATDNNGAKTTSAPVFVSVAANQPPSVTLTSPHPGQAYAATSPPDVTLVATASDPDGRVASVRFYAQSTGYDGTPGSPVLIGTATAPPYQAVWTGVPITVWQDASGLWVPEGAPLDHVVWAEAIDDFGASTASDPATLYVNDRSPYRLNLAAPSTTYAWSDPIVFTAPATIVLVADPTASLVPADVIGRVEFLANDNVVGSLTAPTGTAGEYAFVWRQVLTGMHAVSVRLVDLDGRTSVSAPVNVKVAPPDQPTALAILAPADGQGYNNVTATLSNLPVSAAVTDPDSALRWVQLRVDGEAFAYLYGPPWSGTIPLLSRGQHVISAYGIDTANHTANSRPVFIDVSLPGRYPTVVLTSPTAGATYNYGTPVALTVDVVGVDNVVTKVDFIDTQSGLLGTATTAPFTITRNLTPGTRALKAVAYSGLAQYSESRPITVTVTNTNPPPSVTLTSPANGQTFLAGSAIALAATATDNGVVSKVEFFTGATLLGTDTSAPYAYGWSGAAAGTHTLTAKATDSLGAAGVSPPVTISVIPAVAAINLLAPAAGARVVAAQPFDLTAQAATPGHAIARVEFFADGSPLGTVTVPGGPSAVTATLTAYGVTPGSHTLTARVVATDGYTLTSSGVTVTAVDLAVGLGYPYAGQVFLAPASIRIAAAPSVTGGTIAGVDFLGDGVLLGSRASPPYSFTWTGVPAGAHTITVRARDGTGLVASATVPVTVTGYPSVSLGPGLAGSSVGDDVVNVSGTVQAPANSAVIVNGQFAALDRQGRFYANAVRLAPGTNTLSVTLNTQDGDPIVQTFTLASTGAAPFRLDVAPQEGIAPFTGTLTLTNRGNVPFARVEFDWNDDGTAEATLTSLQDGQAAFTLSFPGPGLYTLRVTVFDQSNNVVYLGRRWVMAHAAQEVASTVGGVYYTLLTRLSANNPAGAVQLFVGDMQQQYADIFASLAGTLPDVASQFGRIVNGVITLDWAELTLVRPTTNGDQAFLVYLVRGEDGIWRFESM